MKITKTHAYLLVITIVLVVGAFYYHHRENYHQCCARSLGVVSQADIDQECSERCQSSPENCVYHPSNYDKSWNCYAGCLGKPCRRGSNF